MQDAIVIIPTYNEIENIEAIIKAVCSQEKVFDVLIVDDNSPDGTARVVKTLQSSYSNQLFLLNRTEKKGLGTAYIDGFKWCLEHSYNYIFEMDADFSHNPKDLVKLYNACAHDGFDLAIGSRYIDGINVVNWPMSRILLSYFASKYVRFITRMKVNDTTAGFVCYKRNVLETIELQKIKFVGYAFQIEMKFKAYLKGFKIKEVPVIFTDRVKGKSKMSGSIISEAVFGVISMKFNSLFQKKQHMKTLITNAKIVNEGTIVEGDILIENEIISAIGKNLNTIDIDETIDETIDARGSYVIPGAIDDQVHFREPGLTHKANIETESKAAIAGGITSFVEMPNTNPQTTTIEELNKKFKRAAETSYANYSFMFGGTNDNLGEILKVNPKEVAGLKLFLGSSTGNMLVDDPKVLERIFASTDMVISVHCEDEATIRKNTTHYKTIYGDDIPIKYHPIIRSEEACYLSSSKAIELAKKTGARLHVFHLSTGKETHLFDNSIPLKEKKITSEVCIHHLWFSDKDYKDKGTHIKWNPAVKTSEDRAQLWEALLDDRIDVIATDHAPHTLEEKANVYTSAPSGGPLVQHAMVALFEAYHEGKISIEKIVEKTAHNPAILFDVEKRGYIKEGYCADLVIIDTNSSWTVSKDNILYKCGWSPFEGTTFKSKITHTFVNGSLVYNNGELTGVKAGKRLTFNR